jgi:hypothetical protein
MKSSTFKTVAAFVLSAASLSAVASTYDGSCTDQPKSKWMTSKDVQTRFEQQGYTVRKVKNSGTCYELYTVDKNGKKAELFVSPVTGAVVANAGQS